MSGKMCAALNQFSYDVMKIRGGETHTKKIVHFPKKKVMIYYFCVFSIVVILNMGPGQCRSQSKRSEGALAESEGTEIN